ncbi:MAG: ribonuclease P protein subunit [Promethearchaeota archaeon]|nr:MAG: ribonuclease P protein subunit [Candidatus Lokiarchaeota archaeon]
MISPRYLIYHDLIGFEVFLKRKSKSKESKFLRKGIIIDETKNLVIIQNENQNKKYIKKDYTFRFKLNNDLLEVDGSKIVGKPENRLRSLKKKKWLK